MKNKNKLILLIIYMLPVILFTIIFPFLIQEIQILLIADNYNLFLSPNTYIYLIMPSFFFGLVFLGYILGYFASKIKFKNNKNQKFWTFSQHDLTIYRKLILISTFLFLVVCYLCFDDYVGINKNGITINKFSSLSAKHYTFKNINHAEIKGEPFCAGRYSTGDPIFSTIFNLYLPNNEVIDIWGSGMAGTPNEDKILEAAKFLHNNNVDIKAIPLDYKTPSYLGCAKNYPYIDPSDPQNIYLSEFINKLYTENLIDN